MNEIRVRLREPSRGGRLYPRYDEEANLLEVESRVDRLWPHGVDIDGHVIFDIDSEGILANFDLIIPRRLWMVTDPFPPRPQASQDADLVFTQETLKHKSFTLPLEVQTDRSRSRLLIRFGKPAAKALSIGLSEQCTALVEGDRLAGFYVILGKS